jgi:hypothetical protein
MNKLLLSLALALGVSTGYAAAPAEPKQEKVCIKTTDAKTGKEVEKCRMVKKHDKLEKVTPTPGK